MRRRPSSMTVILSIAATVSCSTDFEPLTARFYGVATLGASHGTITLAGESSDSTPRLVALTGALELPGTQIALFGNYSPDSPGMVFGTRSFSYDFYGRVSGGIAAGNASSLVDSGAFALFQGGSPASVTRYCGDAVCTGCAESGSFNMM